MLVILRKKNDQRTTLIFTLCFSFVFTNPFPSLTGDSGDMAESESSASHWVEIEVEIEASSAHCVSFKEDADPKPGTGTGIEK